jgi:Flp pilus assembly protein TadB
LFALKSQAAQEQQKMMIQNLQVRNDSINQARDRADKESPMAAMNRRIIILTILALVIFTQVAPVFWDIPTVIPTVIEGFNVLGFQLTPDVVEYVTVEGMLKFDEIFGWATMIIEFYFGAQLAKGR